MHFGSDEMRDLLLLAKNNPKYADEAMEALYDSVTDYTISKIQGGHLRTRNKKKELTTGYVSRNDYDDIAHEVFCNVFKKLDEFLENIQKNDYGEPQRQAWLKSVVYNTLAQYLRKRGTDFLVMLFGDMKKGGDEIPYKSSDDKFALESIVNNILRYVCCAPSKPEKKLAYIFNALIFRESFCHEYNGASTYTADFMQGKSMFSLRWEMIYLIESVYEIRVSAKSIDFLTRLLGDKAPTDAGMTICVVTPKLVTDWTNRIKSYIYKFKSQIFDEEGGSDAIK